MKRLLALGTAALTIGLSSPSAQAAPATTTDWAIKIVGAAKVDPTTRWGARGTTVLIPVQVTCPAGEEAYGIFAGFPGYFADGHHAQPYWQSMTGPTPWIRCTGKTELYTFVGRSVGRNQNPATHPYQYFEHRNATVVVEAVRGDGNGSIRDTKAVKIVVPSGKN